MKKAITALALLLIILNTIAAFAKSGSPDIRVDGNAKGSEWNGCEDNILFVSSPNTKVTQAHMKCAVDYENGIVYYLFAAVNAHGIKLNLFSAGELTLKEDIISPDGEYSALYNSDTEDYSVDAAMNVAGDDGVRDKQFFCEVRVIYKRDLPYSVGGAAQFYDSEDKSTSYSDFSFLTYEAGTSPESQAGTGSSSKETTTKRHRATIPTTTKLTISTSRVQTTAKPRTTYNRAAIAASEEAPEKTTKEKTTKEKTAKEKTTKAKTTKAKSSKSSGSKTTRAAAPAPETVTVIYTVTVTVPDNPQTGASVGSAAFDIKNLPASSLMKITAGAAALVLFGAIGVAAVRSKDSGGTGGNDDDSKRRDTED
jgi:hypothetical protein